DLFLSNQLKSIAGPHNPRAHRTPRTYSVLHFDGAQDGVVVDQGALQSRGPEASGDAPNGQAVPRYPSQCFGEQALATGPCVYGVKEEETPLWEPNDVLVWSMWSDYIMAPAVCPVKYTP